MNKELKIFAWLAGVFVVAYFLPLSNPRVTDAILEAFKMLQWYARNHTLACVIPALFIAGAIVTFLSKEAVLRHLGPRANKAEAYSVASVSGTVLAVCSCSVLPMFAGIYRVGAGLGPASTFLYSGPALNILAIFLTARVLGLKIGVARAVGAILFGVVIGLLMERFFRRDEAVRTKATLQLPEAPPSLRPMWKNLVFFVSMISFLIFSDWYNPGNVVITTSEGVEISAVLMQEMRDSILFQAEENGGGFEAGEKFTLVKSEIREMRFVENWVRDVFLVRWRLAGLMGALVLLMAWRWFEADEVREWMHNTWDFAKLLVPLLYGGVFLVGFLGALIPNGHVAAWVGDNSFRSNFTAAFVGCLFYFATLTEIPILQALMGHGMASGPGLALLLAGPALSLPSLFVIHSIMGLKKTAVFTLLVVVMATFTGMAYGAWA